jgi:hypothetical protein
MKLRDDSSSRPPPEPYQPLAEPREVPIDTSRARAQEQYSSRRGEARNLAAMRAAIASLNEIVIELVDQRAEDEPEFCRMVRETLREHSRQLGFTFQGDV